GRAAAPYRERFSSMAQSGHSSATQRSADEVSRQLVEERFGVLQDRRVEAFSEPAVDRREEITGLGTVALLAPEAGQASCSNQLVKFCTLSLCDDERLSIILLRARWIARCIQQIAPQRI